jgi:hypothetical protein
MGRGPIVAGAALAAALAFVFVAQSRDDGFRSGHRGWVSSHTLAIAEKATPANAFVGHAMQLVAGGMRDFAYFDRYPFFFSLLLHEVGSLARPDKARQIHLARQLMNAVYALTVLALVLLLAELGIPFALAVAASALAASTRVLVEYRDMVHYDQPALLGMVVLLWAIARSRRTGRHGLAIAATAFAVASGRGYASLPLLASWWIVETMPLLRSAEEGSGRLRRVLQLPATRAVALGLAVATAAILWNVAAEADRRDVAWSRTSVVDSATRRLAFQEDPRARDSRRVEWSSFLAAQTAALARSVLPYTTEDLLKRRKAAAAVLAVLVAAVSLVFAAARPPGRRVSWLLVLFAGPAWLLAVPNLTAFHPYTAMYLLPTSAVFFSALLHRAQGAHRTVAAIAACAVLAACTAAREQRMSQQARATTLESNDMTAIGAKLQPGDEVGALRPPLRGAPFALGFYLPEQDIVVEGPANLLVSRSRDARGEDLTPDNRYLRLLYSARPWRTKSPLAKLHRDSVLAQKKADLRRPRR